MEPVKYPMQSLKIIIINVKVVFTVIKQRRERNVNFAVTITVLIEIHLIRLIRFKNVSWPYVHIKLFRQNVSYMIFKRQQLGPKWILTLLSYTF